MSEKIHQRTLTGIVVSNKMNKTLVVAVERQISHARYGKIVKRTSKFAVHNEEFPCNIGDTVEIAECRPVSKTKAWSVKKVVKKAE